MPSASEQKVVEFREWEWSEPLRLSSDQAEALRQAGSDRGQTWLWVEARQRDGSYRVKPRHYVGTFGAAGLRVVVRPKIKLANLFVLLEVGVPASAWREEAAEYESTHDVLPALVSFFARTAETTLARGLFHAYRRNDDDLFALRGRIDFARQFRRGGVLVPMACAWDEFTADADENRCLRSAAWLALRVAGIPVEDRQRLRRMLAALDGVADITTTAALDGIDGLRFTRLNGHYRPALSLARLLLANFTLQDRHGDAEASAFMLDMNKLFEDFMTNRLWRALRGRLEVAPQRRPKLDDEERVEISPDLVLLRDKKTVGVADIKYKLVDGAESSSDEGSTVSQRPCEDGRADEIGVGPVARHADYYQLLAYTAALDVAEGTLIYCADTGEHEPGTAGILPGGPPTIALPKTTITVKNLGKRLHAVAVDLSGRPTDIDAQVAAVADHLIASAR